MSVKEQKLAVYDTNGRQDRKYPVSTSKYGVNDKPGTYGTPVGMHEVVAKIGQGARVGAVFKNRRPTGEVIAPGTPGRDPIVSRIMWLRGMEPQNKNAYQRCIYIHGTADEADVGRAVSYGCIRMKSRDVVDLFNMLPIGSRVYITEASLPSAVKPEPAPSAPPASPQPPLPLNPEGSRPPPPAATLAQNSSRTPREPPAVAIPQRRQSEVATQQRRQPEVATPQRRQSEVATQQRRQPEVATQQRRQSPEPAAPQRRQMPDGSTVIYSAPSSGGPGLTLRSKRKATQALSD